MKVRISKLAEAISLFGAIVNSLTSCQAMDKSLMIMVYTKLALDQGTVLYLYVRPWACSKNDTLQSGSASWRVCKPHAPPFLNPLR